mgnify:CR=1 FL=1
MGVSLGKMGSWAVVAFAMAASSQASEVLRTRIHAVQPGVNEQAPLQVLATQDGRVYDVASSDTALVESLRKAVSEQIVVDLHLAEEVRVQEVTEVPSAELAQYSDELLEAQMAEVEKLLFPIPDWYQPTILASRAKVDELFQSMNRRTANHSQCFQRANYWTFNMYLNQGVKAMKVFLFFSNAYRALDPDEPDDYRHLGISPARDGAPDHRWWFHVAPVVYVQEEGEPSPTEFVLDPGFSVIRSPLLMKDWTDVFVDTHKACPVIGNYSIRQADEDEWIRDRDVYKRRLYRREHCWVRIVPMYTYNPADVERADSTGVPIRSWSTFAMKDMEGAVR